jgi:hypothetical protein
MFLFANITGIALNAHVRNFFSGQAMRDKTGKIPVQELSSKKQQKRTGFCDS